MDGVRNRHRLDQKWARSRQLPGFSPHICFEPLLPMSESATYVLCKGLTLQ
jgi:hypothetical protein